MKNDIQSALRLETAKAIKGSKFGLKIKNILQKPNKKRLPDEVNLLTQ